MKHHPRTLLRYASILILALLALTGMTGSQQARSAAALMPAGGDSSAPVIAQASNPAPAAAAQTGGSGTILPSANVPVMHIPPSAPGSSTGNPGTASVSVS